MSPAEWDLVVAVLTANWPHQLPPDEALTKWGTDLAGEEGDDVLLAVETLYRDGREFPPNGAQIAAKIAELRRSDPDVGEAWDLAKNRRPFSLIHEREQAMAWLEDRSPAVAEAVRRFGPDELAQVTVDDSGIARAQFRRIYEGVVEDRRRADVRGSIDAGMRRLKGLSKPDYTAAIGGGAENR